MQLVIHSPQALDRIDIKAVCNDKAFTYSQAANGQDVTVDDLPGSESETWTLSIAGFNNDVKIAQANIDAVVTAGQIEADLIESGS